MKRIILFSMSMLIVAGVSMGVVSAQDKPKEEPKKEVKAEKKEVKAEKKEAKVEKKEAKAEVKKEEVKK